MIFIFNIIANWSLKFFMAWIMWLLANWLNMPEWATIAMVAIGAAESSLNPKVTYQ